MIQAIRIEHADGIGMFVSNGCTRPYSLAIQREINQTAKNLWYRHEKFNTPWEDNLRPDLFETWFCAYKTIAQMQRWIKPEEFKFLVGLNYKVYLLEVEEYQIGVDQVIYSKESILNKKDITSLFV